MRNLPPKFLLFTVALWVIPAIAAFGQAGFPDPSFGGTGMIQIGFGGASESAQATAVQADGLLLTAGIRQDTSQIIVLRLGTNNLPDPSFGSGGLAALSPPNTVSQPSVSGMAVQPDGKIVVTGTVAGSGSLNHDFMLARFNPDGSADTSFGSGGFAARDLAVSSDDTCDSMILQPDGKIILAGATTVPPSSGNPGSYLTLARFDTNGNFDGSFGSSGVVLNSGGGAALTLALEGDGNILTIAGGTVLRYTTNGILDGTFGSGGTATIPVANQITALTMQKAGLQFGQNPAMIIAAGTSSTGASFVARMSLNGTLDTTFNSVGYVSKSIGTGPRVTGLQCIITGITVRVIKIVISGDTDGGAHFMAARFNGDGSTDTSFGTSGVALTSITGAGPRDNALVIVPGPLLVQVGTSTVSNTCENDIVVARYVYSTGLLDTNFNGTGIMETNIGDRMAVANAVAIQPDGKMTVAGYSLNACGTPVLSLCRLNPDSTFDASFGTGGKAVVGFPVEGNLQTPMTIQPNGNIIVAVSVFDGTNNLILMTRILTNGVLDSSFAGGYVLTSVGAGGAIPSSIALQNDGKIVMSAAVGQGGNDIAILRFNTNGALDTTWNGSGKVFTSIGSSGDVMAALAIQPDGKILNAGASAFSSVARFSMLRLATNAALDNSFGSFGKVATSIPNETFSAGYAMTLQPDHKIILAGAVANAPINQLQMALVRYNTNGTVDSTFGNGGTAIASIGLANSEVYGVAIQSDGKIVAACRAQNGPLYKFAAARFLTNGTLDSAYGLSGVNYIDFGTTADETVNAMALDPAGRMVMVGSASNLFAVARVTGDISLRFTSITRAVNQHTFLTGTGVPSASHTLLKATNVAGPYGFFAPLTTDANGNWQYQDTSVPGSKGFYRFSYP